MSLLPRNDALNDLCLNIAKKFDDQLAELYISTSIEALVFEIALVGLLFFKLGFKAFILLQAFGITLLILLIFSVILHFRKKKIHRNAENALVENQISNTQFLDFLESHQADLQFIYALFSSNTAK